MSLINKILKEVEEEDNLFQPRKIEARLDKLSTGERKLYTEYKEGSIVNVFVRSIKKFVKGKLLMDPRILFDYWIVEVQLNIKKEDVKSGNSYGIFQTFGGWDSEKENFFCLDLVETGTNKWIKNYLREADDDLFQPRRLDRPDIRSKEEKILEEVSKRLNEKFPKFKSKVFKNLAEVPYLSFSEKTSTRNFIHFYFILNEDELEINIIKFGKIVNKTIPLDKMSFSNKIQFVYDQIIIYYKKSRDIDLNPGSKKKLK